MIEAAERAIEREALMTTADMKKGLSGLATIGTTAPFIGLFGTVIGIINAFRGMALTGSGGIAAVSAGIAEALVTTALGLFVAIPAVWLFNIFMNKIERFQVEMSNSASELIDYFIKRRGAGSTCPCARPSGIGGPAMGMGGGGSRRQASERHQRHSARRRLPGAPDHLHGRHAHAPEGRSPSSSRRPTTPDKKPENEQAEADHGRSARLRRATTSDAKWFPKAEFQKALDELYQRNPSTELVIKADQRLKYGDVKEVMKMTKDAGFQNVGLIAEKKQKGAAAKSRASGERARRPSAWRVGGGPATTRATSTSRRSWTWCWCCSSSSWSSRRCSRWATTSRSRPRPRSTRRRPRPTRSSSR